MIKNILFDLDGVLIDATNWHFLALNKALKDIANYEISLDDHNNIFNGLPTKVKLKALVEKGIIDPKKIEDIFKLKQYYTINIISTNCKPDPIKIELMHQLSTYKKACVTNSIYQTSYEMLVRAGLNYYMDYVQGNEATPYPKPNPSPYLKAMSIMGIIPVETLIIEDSDKGYTSAIKSGAHVLKVNSYEEVTLKRVKESIEEKNSIQELL